MITVFCTRVKTPLSEKDWEKLILLLPQNIRKYCMEYQFWIDRHLCLFGKLLLLNGLKNFGNAKEMINHLKYASNGRPYLPETYSIDFNISHSNEYVICALIQNYKIGVDIEFIRDFDFNTVLNVMTQNEWSNIHKSIDPTSKFFDLWTRKESIIKGCSLDIFDNLNQFDVLNDRLTMKNENWYFTKLKIDETYSCHMVSNYRTEHPEIKFIDFYPPS